MRKVLLMIMAIGIIVGAQAQNKNAYKNLKHATAKSLQAKIDVGAYANIPLKPRATTSNKAMEWITFGTSANVYTVLVEQQNWLDANQDLGTIMLTARAGGPWGGSSGDLRCHFTTDWGTTKDSIVFATDGTNLHRYPSGVIHNPAGNTNVDNAFGVVCGPITNGTGWVNNFFHSKQLDGTNENMQYVPLHPDTFAAPRYNLTSGNGHFHAMAPIYNDVEILYMAISNGTFNTGSNIVDWSTSHIFPLLKKRVFSNGTVNWFANYNLAFADNGEHGFAYGFGADSLVDPSHTSIPLVWETWDAGATWTMCPVFTKFDSIVALQDQAFPTRASLGAWPNNPENWEYRFDFPSGAVGNQSMFPGVVDAQGNLHIACLVEGRWSSHPDSLDYSYANHPQLLFDVFRTPSNGWDAIFIDTIRSLPVDAEISGYGTGTDAVGWENMIHISKSPDGNKIFVTWTDTDPDIDTINVMPEIRSWGVDMNTLTMTAPTLFESGNGNIFFLNTSDIILKEGTTYKIPATFFDIYESQQNPINPITHYLMKGVEFNESDFVLPVTLGVTKAKTSEQNSNFVSQNYPNPAGENTKINVNITTSSNINVVVTNMLGQRVFETTKTNAAAGAHNFVFNTANWGKGVYFYTVTAGNQSASNKMIVK